MEFTKEQLEQRRDDILAELNKAGDDIREEFQLDNNPEEQAIQVEQSEVLVAREASLRRELAVIEDMLLNL